MTVILARIPGRALLAAVAVCTTSLVAASVGASAPPALKQKQAQARAVYAQVQALNVQLGRAAESYDGARYRLSQIKVSLRQNAAALARARAGYRVAERRAAARLVAIYEAGEPTTTDALLGATSLSDMLDRIEAVNSTTDLDRRLVHRVSTLRAALATRAAALSEARRQQAQTVSSLAVQRRQIAAGLARHNQLLASIQSEVATLQAQERARQHRLLLEARARLAAQQRARAAAAARAKAAAEAAAREAAARDAATKKAEAAKAAAAAAATTTTARTTTAPPAPPTTTTPPPATATTAPPPTSTAPAPTPIPTPTPTPPSAGPGHPAAASIALRYLGVPYHWGGGNPSGGFDCSGFVMYVYAQLGISLPHFAAAQYQLGSPVSRVDLQPGDLVFFDGLNHVGIWIGGGQFVDAPQTGDVVKIETLVGWYASTYVGARRI